MAESFGVKGRGKFYDETGVIRDVIQNHLFQVVSYLAMEAPSSTYAEAIRDEQAKVLRTIDPMGAGHHSRSIPRLSRRAGRRARTRRLRPMRRCASTRLVALVWRPLLRARGQEPRNDRHRSLRRAQAATAGRLHRAAPAVGNYVRFRLGPQVAIALGGRVKRWGEE